MNRLLFALLFVTWLNGCMMPSWYEGEEKQPIDYSQWLGEEGTVEAESITGKENAIEETEDTEESQLDGTEAKIILALETFRELVVEKDIAFVNHMVRSYRNTIIAEGNTNVDDHDKLIYWMEEMLPILERINLDNVSITKDKDNYILMHESNFLRGYRSQTTIHFENNTWLITNIENEVVRE